MQCGRLSLQQLGFLLNDTNIEILQSRHTKQDFNNNKNFIVNIMKKSVHIV